MPRWGETQLFLPERPSLQMSRILVVIQFLTATALVVSAHFSLQHGIWLCVSAVGVLLGLWAIAAIGPTRVAIMPDVKAKTQLVTAGPYRFVRHPMYTSLLLFGGGFVFSPFHWWKVGVWFVLLFVLVGKSFIEERKLNEQFSEYPDYSKRTFRFVPFLW